MTFNRVNNISGWTICVIACIVYIMTMEATGSFWDCGEFISSTFKMQVPHPPGAPLFVMLGRLFIVSFEGLFGSGPESAARAVNMMSALASGFTILFLFWSITHFARKIVVPNNETPNGNQLFSIMAAGAVGALAYTFSDSFWFSAVEGEVYGMSSLFTALVFWAMLKWEHNADKPSGDKWVILIFFLMGLSIGIHLLGLLTIPAIVMIYYFKRFKVTPLGTLWAFLIGCAITGFVQKVMIQYTVAGAGKFDIWFVNNLGLPFFSGFIFYFIIVAAFIYWGLKITNAAVIKRTPVLIWLSLFMLLLTFPFITSGLTGFALIIGLAGLLIVMSYTYKKSVKIINLSIWSIAFMLLGYSSYVTTMIRSNANPAVDMYNVDNPNSLVGYLGRDQYGDFPLIYGQVFTAQPENYADGEMKYTKGETKDEKTGKVKGSYIEIGRDPKPVYASDDMMLFPRVWDASNDQGHATFYKDYLDLAEGEKPNFFHNIKFFVNYQVNWMYLRYFMWNFAGKQNDIQGFAQGNVRDGNWISGISFIDDLMLGDQSKMPDSIKYNKANNKLFFLPLILGIIGAVFHYMKSKKDFLVVGLLFFFTGFAIVLYLNQAGNQPRERDYAYVGSFYAFAIWIGLGVLQVSEWLKKKLSITISNSIAFAVCMLAVPVLMGQQEWDDHDRSKKVLARDLAKDYLESCAPNAILFTYGDNDTYPLWYAQEVEHIRPDIRVINNSLLGIDWYINQLRYKVNESDPIDVIWDEEKIQGNNRNYIYVNPRPELDKNAYFDLYQVMKDFVGSDEPDKKVTTQGGESLNYLPTRKLKIGVDEKTVRANGTVNAKDSVVSDVLFELPDKKNVVVKNDLAILNIIAANKWKRPIYFTAPYSGSELGLSQYLRKDGLTYRLVPVKNNSGINIDWVVDKLMHKFAFGSANIKGVYFDEQNRLHLNSIRSAYADGAAGLADIGRKDEAKKLLDMADKGILESNHPYAMVSHSNQHDYFTLRFLEACYKAGYKELGDHVSKALHKDFDQQMKYYQSLPEGKQEGMKTEAQGTQQLIQMLTMMESQYKGSSLINNPELQNIINNTPDSGTKNKDSNKK
jgi:Protein of unknown function (DUF2723)